MKVLFGFGLSSLVASGLRAISLPLMGWVVAPDVFAEFNLWQIALALFVLLTSLGLNHSLSRDFYASPESEQLPLILQILLIKMIAVFFIGGLIFVTWWFVRNYDFLPQMWQAEELFLVFFLYIFAAGILQCFYSTVTQYLRLKQAAGLFAIVEISGRLFWLISLASIWLLDNSTVSIIQLFSIWLFVLFLNCVVLFLMVKDAFISALKYCDNLLYSLWCKKIKQMLRYGRPVLLSEFLYWCLTASGVFLLSIWHGLDTLALFTMAIAIGSLGSMLGQVFNTVWLPEVYRAFGKNSDVPWLADAAFKITWLTVFCIVLAGAGGWVVTALLPTHYAGMSGMVMAAFCKPMLMSLQRVTAIGIELSRVTWISPIFMLIALALQFILARWLVPLYAANGAIVSLLISTWFFWQCKSMASARLWRPVGGAKIYIPIFLVVVTASAMAILS